jgi:hypothetical protein
VAAGEDRQADRTKNYRPDRAEGHEFEISWKAFQCIDEIPEGVHIFGQFRDFDRNCRTMWANRDLQRHPEVCEFFGVPDGTEDPNDLRRANARWRDWIISRSEWVYRVENAPFNEMFERVRLPRVDQSIIDGLADRWFKKNGVQKPREPLPA